MESVGKVLAETTAEYVWNGYHQIYQVVIVDVGTKDVEPALSVATKRLQKHGWVIEVPADRFSVGMGSRKWGNVRLWLYGLDYIGRMEDLKVEEKTAIEKARKLARSETVVFLEAIPSG